MLFPKAHTAPPCLARAFDSAQAQDFDSAQISDFISKSSSFRGNSV